MQGGFIAPPAPPPEVFVPSVLEQGWDAVSTFGEDDSLPSNAPTAAPAGFLPGSPLQEAELDAAIQEADLDAAFSSGTPDPASIASTRLASSISKRGAVLGPAIVSMRGAVMAPASNSSFAHPGTDGPEAIDVLPASAGVRGTFTMRGELMHCFETRNPKPETLNPKP